MEDRIKAAISLLSGIAVITKQNEIFWGEENKHPRKISEEELNTFCLVFLQQRWQVLLCQAGIIILAGIIIFTSIFLSRNMLWTIVVTAIITVTEMSQTEMILISVLRLKCLHKEWGRHHGAEHMVLNAYEQLGRVPTVHEAQSASRCHKNCGSVPVCKRLILEIGLVLTVFLPIPLAMILVAIVLKKHLWLQILFTNKPEDEDLRLMVELIEFLEKN